MTRWEPGNRFQSRRQRSEGPFLLARVGQGSGQVWAASYTKSMHPVQVRRSSAWRLKAAETPATSECRPGLSTSLDKEIYPALRNLGDRATEHVVALDGIAIIVNPHNPVTRLSIPQLRAIYTSQITNWKDVGGIDAPIEIYGRDRNSGTFEMFIEKVIGKDTISNAEVSAIPLDHQIGDSSLIVDSVMRSTERHRVRLVTHD